MNIAKGPFVALLVLLNAVPVYGVLYWDWHSFDLIFLYWLENLVIGLFMILRFLVRPYSHLIELIYPVFLVPFFTVHYGMFCFVHGTFVIGLFGKGLPTELAQAGIPEIILPMIESRHLLLPVLALIAYQALDWLRDTSERGLGSDAIKDLMTAPYRRIIVLHITILASGFALGALNEPMVGLFILIFLKTGFDIYHWNKDELAAQKSSEPVINDKIKKKIDAFLDKPTITVNGKEIFFNSFDELRASNHYGLLQAIMRMAGGSNQLVAIESYVEQRMKQRQHNN